MIQTKGWEKTSEKELNLNGDKQSIQVKVKVFVAQSRLTLSDPTDCSPPDFSVRGILQARILEWVTIPFFRESSQPRDWKITFTVGRFFLSSEPPGKSQKMTTKMLSELRNLDEHSEKFHKEKIERKIKHNWKIQ